MMGWVVIVMLVLVVLLIGLLVRRDRGRMRATWDDTTVSGEQYSFVGAQTEAGGRKRSLLGSIGEHFKAFIEWAFAGIGRGMPF
jgi:hypothetical protein